MVQEFFYSRDSPFGTVLFLFTIPLNLFYLFGSFIVDPFIIIPIEFFIFNFIITLAALFYVTQSREWSSCF